MECSFSRSRSFGIPNPTSKRFLRRELIQQTFGKDTIRCFYVKQSIRDFSHVLIDHVKCSIGHVRYINILTWLRGFQDKLLNLALFSLFSSLFWEFRDKRNLKNLQFWPESLGAMWEYWYIKRGLFPESCFRGTSIALGPCRPFGAKDQALK